MGGADQRLAVDLLGPVVAQVGGVERPLTAGRQRAVLACLAVHLGRAVSADELLEAVWADDLPRSGVKAVAYQVSKLRSALEPERDAQGTLVLSGAAGYELAPTTVVDIHEFDRLVGEASDLLAADPAESDQRAEAALGLWRGEPLADVQETPFVAAERQRLDIRRRTARRIVAEARLGQGNHLAAAELLEELIAEDPFEERLVQSLMLALHRSGRTAAGLRAFGDLRRRLSEELGIEPSRAIQQVELQLLGGEAASATAVVGAPRAPAPIPAPLSTFLGRADEIAQVAELLEASRLVTLTGFGGLGKTRLAQEAARGVADRFTDGVCYVDLTTLTEPAGLAERFGEEVGIDPALEMDPVDHLVQSLAARSMLLVVDNSEHVVTDVAALVGRILGGAPDVRVLVTSRVRLGAAGEAVLAVPPLPSATGVELFRERARLVRSGLDGHEKTLATVERLCEALDGVPLAIEMAAGRLAVMSPSQLEASIEAAQLRGSGNDERQGSMQAVMAWSCDLLSETERALLGRLATCVGGFSLDTAEALASGLPGPDDGDVVDMLGRLVDASLVVVEDMAGERRFRLLEVVRQFAAGMLDEDEREHAALDHARHFREVASRIRELETVDAGEARRLGDTEIANIRAALGWAHGSGRALLGLEIVDPLCGYFNGRMLSRESLRWHLQGLDAVDDPTDPQVLRAATGVVIEAYNVHDYEARRFGAALLRRGLASVEDPNLKGAMLSALGVDISNGDPRAAQQYYLTALDLGAADPLRAIAFLNNLMEETWMTGTLDPECRVIERLEDALAELTSEPPNAIKIRGVVAVREGEWHDALRIAEEAPDLDETTRWSLGLVRAEALTGLDRAEEALAALDELGEPDFLGDDLWNARMLRASAHLRLGQPGLAMDALQDVVDEIGAQHERSGYGVPVGSLMGVAALDLGDAEAAAGWFGYASSEMERLDLHLRPSDVDLVADARTRCRDALGAEEFAALAADGASADWTALPAVSLDARAGDTRSSRA